jgi:hypothetical protein
MNLRRAIFNLGLLVVSVGFGLLVAEFAARLFLNPSDFLSLEVVPDNILGAAPSRSALAAFDKWGFRNTEVPKTADIVAVGDSHTYGNTARMVDSWPYVLGRLTGRQVYNMGLGGYGPNQYFYLSKTKALRLKPKMIIWGLYMGDDFENAFSITYGLDYWGYLRKLNDQKVEPNIWEDTPGPPSWNKDIRVWLSRHSLVYQLALHSGFGARLNGKMQIMNAAQIYSGLDTSLIIPEKNIFEAFRPHAMLFGLDQQDSRVREGMRITFELLKQMNDLCKENHVDFRVVVIPTKEMVFSAYLEHNSELPLHDVTDKVLANERLALAQVFQFMTDTKIPYVDPLPELQRSAGQSLYAASAGDMHPSKNGYRVIAEAVAEQLKQREVNQQAAISPQ